MDDNMTTIKKYQLKNLDCANCAQKIEDGVKGLDEVNFASVNFATATLHVDTSDFGAVRQTIGKIESAIELLPVQDNSPIPVEDTRSEEVVLVISGILFVLGILINEFYAVLKKKLKKINKKKIIILI